ncbi:hypothetical protein QJS10_CPB18g00488 [Acorus calamus]|uniref:Protein Iojap-related, mitochondrial n=1 Tax=Acorus calamus TaxID=4465 RepID=A0AAV9CPN7_ACOCL|nr:hypothetical protein QJS10_CPB18g00488 [Acorus calamus]
MSAITKCRYLPTSTWRHLGFPGFLRHESAASPSPPPSSLLDLHEVEKVLTDVKAGDVRVIPVGGRSGGWTDFMVVASGRSAWHVRNIAQALVHKVKQKQKGSERLQLPSVEGVKGGNWIVIDSGTVIVHALEEKARSYYNLEGLWMKEMSPEEPDQDLGRAFMKVRRINNSKKQSVQT